jgi:hypothetical protein
MSWARSRWSGQGALPEPAARLSQWWQSRLNVAYVIYGIFLRELFPGADLIRILVTA